MKVLGISCGRKMSNTEILVKEALMGAKETGAEVVFIRLQELNLKPCTGCNACVIDLLEKSGSGKCVLKDDFEFLDEQLLACDGLILGAPIYEKTAPGQLKILNDRLGPSHDMAFKLIAKQTRAAKNVTTGKGPDPRSFMPKAASLIAVGGSEWDTLALPMMHLSVLSMQYEVVDKMLVNWVALPGVVALYDQWLERARNSGVHLVETLKKPLTEATYIGDKGVCPICHSKLFEINNVDKVNPAICGICGVKGTLTVQGDSVSFTVTEEQRALSHVNLSGKFHHAKELKEISLVPHPDMNLLPEKMGKYKAFIEPLRP
ncbi:flavodoxin family protein [Fusibacter sp. 3D3]|uniref:flavodoxin family protein n=1 Tax=Fusibacter sp. 3D3 TaxID=1048380 RepID=UPI000852C528|nr:flavodoxin family protein [Fusibacter sp. 3D3]GAU79522.1 iron-sulfur flavoprotein [Fusibacter sp. 3D3]